MDLAIVHKPGNGTGKYLIFRGSFDTHFTYFSIIQNQTFVCLGKKL